jgi:hypothetical protein
VSVAALAILCAVAAQPPGEIQRDGKDVTITWTATVSATPDEVVDALKREPSRAVSGVRTLSPRDDGLRIVRKTPFFLPKVWFDVRVVVEQSGEAVKVRWVRLAGTAKRYARTWTIRPAPGGATVAHVFEIQIPFDLPDLFVQGQLKRQLAGDRARLEALFAR